MTLLEIFDKAFIDTKFDHSLAKALYGYQVGFINEDINHLEFFGGNLLGAQTVRFKDKKVIAFFDLVDVDFITLTEALLKAKDINQNYKISSDVLNLTLMYVIHRFMISDLSPEQKDRALYDCGLIFFYRCIAALISHYFKYTADPKIVQAAYANLSNRFLIKKLGSWYAVMDYRAKDLVNPSGLHYQTLLEFNNDLEVVYCINDAQSRVRDIIKGYYVEFVKANESGVGISHTTSFYIDGETNDEKLKDKTGSLVYTIEAMLSIVRDPHAWLQPELVDLIVKMNKNTSYKTLYGVLAYISDSANRMDTYQSTDLFIRGVIIHSYNLITNNCGALPRTDYFGILGILKNFYLSSRSDDEHLLALRERGEAIVRATVGVESSDSLIMATRLSVILYITLRTLLFDRG